MSFYVQVNGAKIAEYVDILDALVTAKRFVKSSVYGSDGVLMHTWTRHGTSMLWALGRQ